MRKRIDEIADVRTGYQFRHRLEPDPAGAHLVVQVKDIDVAHAHRLDPAALWPVKLPREPGSDLLRQGDVLYLAKGRRNYATPVGRLPGSAVAAGYFFVLRVRHEAVRPDFLAWYINQPPAQKYLADFFRGTGIPFIRREDFAALEVPLPPLDVQERIVALHALALRESELLSQLESKRTQLIRGLCLAAACRNTHERSEQANGQEVIPT